MKLRPRAEVFCFKRNQVLCGFRKDYVVFPGGGVDSKESARDAAIRECQEEAGRRLINCTVAHPPTMQPWSDDYKKSRTGEVYDGSFTYWMTGSTSSNPVAPGDRHRDYETTMDWHPVKSVILRLKRELKGDWKDDVGVRIKVLETHVGMQEKHADGGEVSSILVSRNPNGPFPVLHASKSFLS